MGCQFNPVVVGIYIGAGIVLGTLLKTFGPKYDNTPSPAPPGPTPSPTWQPTMSPMPSISFKPTVYIAPSYKDITLVSLPTDEDFDRFSVSLSDNGDVLAIGGPGYVLISKYNENTEKWDKWSDNITSSLPDDMLENELRFGETVALSGDGNVLAVSSFFSSDGGKGIVQTFKNNGTAWITRYLDEAHYINLTKENPEGSISLSLDEDGNTLVVGVSNPWKNNNYDGYVDIFYAYNNYWAIWESIRGTGGDACGYSTSVDDEGDVFAVGCNRARDNGENSGKVMIFMNYRDVLSNFTIQGDQEGDYSGTSVSLNNDGDRVAIGSPGHNTSAIDDAGECRAYERNGDEWEKIGESIIGEKPNYKFGENVALSGDGARLASATAYEIFKVYEYKSSDWSFFWESTNLSHGSFEDIKMNEKGDVIATSVSIEFEMVTKVYVYREQERGIADEGR